MEPAASCSTLEKTSPAVPWKEMFRSASFKRPSSDSSAAIQSSPEQEQAYQIAHSSNPKIRTRRSFSMDRNHGRRVTFDSDSSGVPWQAMFRSASFRSPDIDPRNHDPSLMDNRPPFEEINVASAEISSANTLPSESLLTVSQDSAMENNVIASESSTTTNATEVESNQKGLTSDLHIRIALYITMAQAGLALIILLFYTVYELVEEYLRPILWAVVCSISLRGIQDTLVEFWSGPLRSGLMDTVLAVPVAVVKVLVGTIMDARDIYYWAFCGTKLDVSRTQGSGFLRLFRRLVSFGVFVFVYEQIGAVGSFALVGMGFMFCSNLSPSTISAFSSLRSASFRLRNNSVDQSKISTLVAQWILRRLKSILAMGLIMGLIFGFLAGAIFFSYRIGAEGKDAMVSIKSHIEESNFAEKLGIKRWIHENEIMEMMDHYTSECYETLLHQIDNLGIKYNLTEFFEVIKHLVVTPTNSSALIDLPQQTRYYIVRMRNLKSILMELLFSKEEMLEKAKCLAAEGIDLFLQVLASSKFIFDGTVELVFSIGHSMLSGAAGVLNFILHSTVFFWVLYYLLTSESNGVTEQVIQMLPIPIPAKRKCVDTLNHAISDVLLATAEIAFFQGCFTWLLCRLYSIHFVYMSTILAFISSLLPIFPPWLPTLPAALQLLLDGRYIPAISFCITHLVLMDYGASEIVNDIPGYSAYLTGVSIIGGMTVFPSALEGAILGPLITTVVIALKDLYTEFVLNEPKDKDN
ncbi:hypothetical protein Ancab_024906 [Ancistrocladus abbreviatus]